MRDVLEGFVATLVFAAGVVALLFGIFTLVSAVAGPAGG